MNSIPEIGLSLLLVANPTSSHATLHGPRVATVPTTQWPAPCERPEDSHPGHGEGADESPLYGGVAYTNTSARVVVDSSASGAGPTGVLALWPGNNFILVTPLSGLPRPFLPFDQVVTSLRANMTVRIEPRTKQFFRDGTTRRTTGSRSGR